MVGLPSAAQDVAEQIGSGARRGVTGTAYVLVCMVPLFCCTASPRYTHLSYQGATGGSFATTAPGDAPDPGADEHLSTSSQAGNFQATGEASYYANKFNGRKTASGERYDRTRFTAAHRTLPFGTMVKVTNLRNNLSVTVRINDRGPQKRSRIIDLSAAAARKIGMISEGIARVGIEVVGN